MFVEMLQPYSFLYCISVTMYHITSDLCRLMIYSPMTSSDIYDFN